MGVPQGGFNGQAAERRIGVAKAPDGRLEEGSSSSTSLRQAMAEMQEGLLRVREAKFQALKERLAASANGTSGQ